MSSLSGHAVYRVRFTADVFSPAVGDVLTCRVEFSNSYGVLAVNLGDTRVLDAIMQHDPVSFQHAENIADLEPGDLVTLEVMIVHFKLGQKVIALVGRAVSKDHAPKARAVESDDDDDGDVDVSASESELGDDAPGDVEADAEPDAEPELDLPADRLDDDDVDDDGADGDDDDGDVDDGDDDDEVDVEDADV